MKKKYIMIFLSVIFALLIIPNKVFALSTSQYTYDVSKATYTNGYTVTQLPLEGWIFNICNSSNFCQIVDATNLKNTAYGTFVLSNIDGINIVQGGNTTKLYFEVYFNFYSNIAGTFYYNYSDYYESRQYRLYMSNSSYSDRRQVIATNVLKSGMTAPTGSTYLNMQFRFDYDFATNSFTSVYSPSSVPSSLIQTNQTLIKINYSSYDIYNTNDGYAINSNLYYSNNWVNPLPSYLDGYKKVTLSNDLMYAFLSNIQSGSIFIKKSDFEEFGGKLAYYDLDIESQPYSSVIQDFTVMSDNKYVRQDFNLSTYEGSDFVVFNKYLYLEGNEDISYDIYVPNDIYVSLTRPVPNEQNGNDFDFEYQDSEGVIHNGSYVSSSSDTGIQSFFGNFTNALKNFQTSIVYIGTLFTGFYDNLPVPVQYTIIVLFSSTILIAIYSYIF